MEERAASPYSIRPNSRHSPQYALSQPTCEPAQITLDQVKQNPQDVSLTRHKSIQPPQRGKKIM